MTGPMLQITAPAAAMLQDGIDTDVIFPARFLLRMDKAGLGECLFADQRSKDSFPLDRPDRRPVQIIFAGDQFGCGSSREHAVWSLVDYGIRAVIAPGFGEIFANNAARNGLAAVRLCRAQVAMLARESAVGEVTIDLVAKTISTSGGTAIAFDIPEADRLALINGWDEIDVISDTYQHEINAFEARYRQLRPWLFKALERG